MSRTIEFESDKLTLHLTGFTSAAALKRNVEIPYASIAKVSVEDFKVAMLQFRVGTSIADVREGRFLIGDRWCFVSYEDHHDVIVLELADHQFAKVVFQVDNPEETKRQILEHMAVR